MPSPSIEYCVVGRLWSGRGVEEWPREQTAQMQSPPRGCADLLCMCCNNNVVFALAALVQHISCRFDGFQPDRRREREREITTEGALMAQKIKNADQFIKANAWNSGEKSLIDPWMWELNLKLPGGPHLAPPLAADTLTRPGTGRDGRREAGLASGTRLFCCKALFIIHLIWKTDCEATAQLSVSNKAQTQIIHERAKEKAAERGGKIISERRQRDSSWQGLEKNKKTKHVRVRRCHLSGHSAVTWPSFRVTAGRRPCCNCGSKPEND